jgi:hypothetical protein|eukprot:COSAG06_NODE_14711_length_1132_cov_3.986447_1_plen_135_part_00
MLKLIILPRQARDKRRKTHQKREIVLSQHQHRASARLSAPRRRLEQHLYRATHARAGRCRGRVQVSAPFNIRAKVKRLKLRLSGSARKSYKRFQDTPRFKLFRRFGSNPAVFITQRRETGRPIPIYILRLIHQC